MSDGFHEILCKVVVLDDTYEAKKWIKLTCNDGGWHTSSKTQYNTFWHFNNKFTDANETKSNKQDYGKCR